MILFYLLLILIGIIILIFGSYTLLYYLYSKKEKPISSTNLNFPSVTLIIPFLNESVIMKKKIEDTSKIRYPKNKFTVVFLDDHSTDNSIQIIKENTKKFPFKFKIISNEGEKGKSNALNYIFPKLTSEITIITDADSLIKENAIEQLVQDFKDQKIGGTNAKLVILEPQKNKNTYHKETLYRFFYDIWRQGESNLDSVSICNGPLMAFRTKLIKDVKLNSKVDDSELVFDIIRKKFRFVYNKEAIIYEISPTDHLERTKQKMRRVRGLMYLYLKNLGLMGKGKFGKIILPYALLTHVISPYVILLGSVIYSILLFQIPYLYLTLLFFLIPKVGSFARSFISTQILMAFSPFFARGWNTSTSSREELNK